MHDESTASVIAPESQTSTATGHSSLVEMRLTVGDDEYSVRQMGPTFVMLRDPVERPACEGEMFLSVDGSERRWRVNLPHGISPDVDQTPIEAI